MANKTPGSPGGKLLATEVFAFMKDNIDAMKKDGASRDAAVNEVQGTQDIANAIAFAIEKVFGTALMTSPGPAIIMAPAAIGVPPTGTIDLSMANPKYVFKGA
jgi:hypothetical protein